MKMHRTGLCSCEAPTSTPCVPRWSRRQGHQQRKQGGVGDKCREVTPANEVRKKCPQAPFNMGLGEKEPMVTMAKRLGRAFTLLAAGRPQVTEMQRGCPRPSTHSE